MLYTLIYMILVIFLVKGVNMMDARPSSMGKRFAANFNSSAGSRLNSGMRQSSSGSSLSTMVAQGSNDQQAKQIPTTVLAMNKLKKGSGK